jgi:methylated-DNA-protein-cysteine methyltransferase related protein
MYIQAQLVHCSYCNIKPFKREVAEGKELNRKTANVVHRTTERNDISLFTPLFARIRQKYSPFPVSCGISFDEKHDGGACFVRARDKRLLFSRAAKMSELEPFISVPHFPDVVCIAASQGQRKSSFLLPAIQSARLNDIPVIFTETEAVLAALGLTDKDTDHITRLLWEAGFALRPETLSCPATALVAITGYFYLNKEYEVVEKNVVPLLLERNPLFHLLRRIPYGEVATYREASKELGLHWGEKELMQELQRLPFGADVPSHRLVGKDGSLSRFYPGGLQEQRERLKWELVPFADQERVDLQRAEWGRHKYRPLTNYLRHIAPEVRFAEIRFQELEQIIGELLPRAAHRLGSWWRDEKPYAGIWLEAGWSVIGVNLQLETVTFSRLN